MFQSKLHFYDALKLASAFVVAYLLFILMVTLKDVLLIFFTSLILAIAMDQVISRFEGPKLSRTLAAALIYLCVLLAAVAILIITIPPLFDEVRNFLVEYPVYSDALELESEIEIQAVATEFSPWVRNLSESLTGSPAAVFNTLLKTFNNFAHFIAIFFVAFFMTIQPNGVRSFFEPFVPKQHQKTVSRFWDKMQERIGGWLWGKTICSLIVGATTTVGLFVLGVPYALILGVLAAFMNFIPFAGPIIAAIPAIALGFSSSVILGVVVALYYFVVNNIFETFILEPFFMRKAVEISPAFLILAIIAGGYLGGVLGIILAIPTAAIIYLVISDWNMLKKNIQEDNERLKSEY